MTELAKTKHKSSDYYKHDNGRSYKLYVDKSGKKYFNIIINKVKQRIYPKLKTEPVQTGAGLILSSKSDSFINNLEKDGVELIQAYYYSKKPPPNSNDMYYFNDYNKKQLEFTNNYDYFKNEFNNLRPLFKLIIKNRITKIIKKIYTTSISLTISRKNAEFAIDENFLKSNPIFDKNKDI